MKKLLAIFSLLAFVAVYAVPAMTMPQDQVKTVKVEAKKTAKASKAESKAACCEAEKATTASCCSSASKEEGKSCAATCKEASSCKGMTAEKKK
jgi:hypothetical protein